jgi:hypothetical protein
MRSMAFSAMKAGNLNQFIYSLGKYYPPDGKFISNNSMRFFHFWHAGKIISTLKNGC